MNYLLRAALVVVLVSCLAVPASAGDPVTRDSIESVMDRVVDWQLDHMRNPLDDWTSATFFRGLTAAWQATGDERYLDELLAVGRRLDWKPGPRYRHADDHAIAQTYLELFEHQGDPAMIAPFRATIDRMMATPPDWEKSYQSIDFWWCDALFMSPPALAGLANATGSAAYLDFMDELWRQTYETLWDSAARLFYRDTNFRVESPGVYWLRGNGWVLAGLALVLEELPANRSARDFYLDVYRQMAGKVASIQPEDGLWRSDMLSNPRSAHGETSGSALVTFALAWGINNSLLDRETYLPVVDRAWRALARSVDRNGRLGYVQKPGGGPGSARRWHAEAYGSGAFLLAGSEMLELVGD